MLPMDAPGCHILGVELVEQGLLVTVEADARSHACPKCGQESDDPHSRYVRRLWDLPVQGRCVRIRAIVRRWRCLNRTCSRATFSDPLTGLAERYAQRTNRMTAVLQCLVLFLSSTTSAKVARRIGMEVSARTVLRTVGHEAVQVPTPRVLGVDDFALARGRVYGTLLCDLETGRPIDVLPGRTRKGLQEWLQNHPGIEIIARDRASSYAEAARAGAPEAIQVADRFHLVRNVSDALRAVVDRQPWALSEPVPLPDSVSGPERGTQGEAAPHGAPDRRVPRAEQRKAAAADRRRRRYEEVRQLRARGLSVQQIRKATGFHRRTIRKYLESNGVPQRAEKRRPSLLDPFVDHLGKRWRAGCHNVRILYNEIVEQGFTGSVIILRHLLHPWRMADPKPPQSAPSSSQDDNRRPKWKDVRWAVLCPPERLTGSQHQDLQNILALHPPLALAHGLVQRFRQILQERTPTSFDAWLTDAAQSKLPPFERLARTLEADRPAVLAAVELPWSTGQVEGFITRVKLVKRIGYGRAGLSLLRARILACA